MSASELHQAHLADLHARAAEAGIEGYRLLRREELIERLEGGEGQAPRRARRGRRGGRGRGGRERERLPADSDRTGRAARERAPREGEDDAEPAATEDVTGILELTRQRHGFLRLGGLRTQNDDVYVSASQVRRCELRPGDEVSGPAREPRRGERHRALVHVDKVNGGEPQEEGRIDFDELTPVPPSRPIELPADAGPMARSANRLSPLAYGQRVLVRAAPRPERTALLRELGQGIAAGEARLIVLLIDERPEEVPAWEDALPDAELALAPADLAPSEQTRIAGLALERGRRIAEAGGDAVLICDSLTRLAVAADGVAEVKRLFGSGRELAEEGTGSLTVVATVLADGEDEGAAERAVATTETGVFTIDEVLADVGG